MCLTLNFKKCAVVFFSAKTVHVVRRLQRDIPGASQFLGVETATYLGSLIGPSAAKTFWDKAMSKYCARAHSIRHAPGHMQDKLAAYRTFATSVLRYLGQYVAPPPALARQEAAVLASCLAAPMHAIIEEAMWGLPRCGSPVRFTPTPIILEAAAIRFALRHPPHSQHTRVDRNPSAVG